MGLKKVGRLADKREYYDLKQAVFTRDNWKCRACRRRENLHAHHIVFRSAGGEDSSTNLCTVCSTCHDEIHARRLFIYPGGCSVFFDANKELRFIR